MRDKLSIEEPVSRLRHVPIIENREPLVSWLGHPRILQDKPRFNYRRETVARQSVKQFLWRAADALPIGYKFAIVEGWRPPYIQRRMFAWSYARFKEKYPDWTEARLRRLASQFTAPMDERVPPPHTTGGAVDLMLADESGRVLDHFTPYHPRDHKCFLFDAPGLSDTARRHRDIVAEAMATGGMTNYPSEYWHWSYGDQGWAYRGRLPAALYGEITPIGWEPCPDDDNDDALTYIWVPEP
jgi:zinc D-Ala-D-Ala dipeptidase